MNPVLPHPGLFDLLRALLIALGGAYLCVALACLRLARATRERGARRAALAQRPLRMAAGVYGGVAVVLAAMALHAGRGSLTFLSFALPAAMLVSSLIWFRIHRAEMEQGGLLPVTRCGHPENPKKQQGETA
jgi:hypothetical protein